MGISDEVGLLQQTNAPFDEACRRHVKAGVFELLHEHRSDSEEQLRFDVALQVPVWEADFRSLRDHGSSDGCSLLFGDTWAYLSRRMGDGLSNRLLAFVDQVHD